MVKYQVRVVGFRDPIIVSKVEGEGIITMWEDDEVSSNTIIPIAENKIRKSEIKAILKFDELKENNEDERKTNDERNAKQYAQYLKNRFAFIKLAPEIKAKSMEWFKIVYKAYSGLQDAPADLKVEVYNRQLAYYRDNPKRWHCDPVIYKDLIPSPKIMDMGEGITMKGRMIKAGIRVVEKVTQEDISLSR